LCGFGTSNPRKANRGLYGFVCADASRCNTHPIMLLTFTTYLSTSYKDLVDRVIHGGYSVVSPSVARKFSLWAQHVVLFQDAIVVVCLRAHSPTADRSALRGCGICKKKKLSLQLKTNFRVLGSITSCLKKNEHPCIVSTSRTAKKKTRAKNQTVFYSPTHVAQSFIFARSHSSSSTTTCTNPLNVVVLLRFSSPSPSNNMDAFSSDSDDRCKA
jgi:hypothetical protein